MKAKIGKVTVQNFTNNQRDKILIKLSVFQKETLYKYRKWLWISNFQTDLIGDTEWSFVGYKEDEKFEISLGNSNSLHCECGRGIKYQYEIYSSDHNIIKHLGISHLSQHLSLKPSVIREIISKNNRVQYDIDTTLWLYTIGEEFPHSLYEQYKKICKNKITNSNFHEKMKYFSKANFPIFFNEKERLKKEIISTIFDSFSFSAKNKKVRINKLSQNTGWPRKELVTIFHEYNPKIKSTASSIEEKELKKYLKYYLNNLPMNSLSYSSSIHFSKSLITYFEFPENTFDEYFSDHLYDIIYETLLYEKKILISELLEYILSKYTPSKYLGELNIEELIIGLVQHMIKDGLALIDGSYIRSTTPNLNNVYQYNKNFI
ncbi:hypothetical protein VNN37_10335 (plasmid) [Lactococcus garvieae]|uniref:hypothetical protein n=1 Tax=Lactococcus garvieae TaxID=1363 RepID=UPI0030CED09D